MSRSWMVGGAALMVLAGSAWADPDAVERLQSAAQALRDARSLSYHVKISSEGTLAQFGQIKVNGTVVMRRLPNQEHGWEMRREGVAEVPTIGEMKYLVVSNDRTTQWIDHDKKTLFERYTGSARDRQVTVAANAWVKQLGEREPFAKDIAAPTTTLEGREEKDGVLCEIVFADYGENREKYRWWLGAADHMPRRLEWILDNGTFKNVTTYEFSQVQLNPELPDDTFALKPPEGYKEERVPAPGEFVNEMTTFPDQGVQPHPEFVQPMKIMQLPPFELAGPGGEKVSLDGLKGSVVVIDFWGTWCRPCEKSTPEVQALAERFKDQKVKVLGVAVRQKDRDEPINYFKEKGLTYQLLLDGDQFAKDCRVTKYPTFIVAGFRGEVLAYKESFKVADTFAEIGEVIQKYLDSGGTYRPSVPAPGAAGGAAAGDGGNAADGASTSTTGEGATTTTTKPKDDDN